MSSLVFPSLPIAGWPKRSAEWLTLTQGSVSGAETHVSLWTYPRWHWEIPLEGVRDSADMPELKQLIGLYNAVHGRGDSFLYQDPNDHAVTAQALGVGDGEAVAFQLLRSYGGFVEPIWAPAAVTRVTVGGVPASGWTVAAWGDDAPGVVTLAEAPAAGAAVAADFSWYWPVWFEEDTLTTEQFAYQLWTVEAVKLKSIKLGG